MILFSFKFFCVSEDFLNWIDKVILNILYLKLELLKINKYFKYIPLLHKKP